MSSQSIFSQIVNRVFSGSMVDFQTWWEKQLIGDSLSVVFTPNPEQVVQAEESSRFAEALLQADALIPDGVGLVWAARFFSGFQKSFTRITGVDVLEWWLREAEKKRAKTFLVGGQAGVAQAACDRFDSNGAWCSAAPGYVDVAFLGGEESSPALRQEERELLAQIKKIRPAVVIVGFGAPLQEYWVLRHRTALQAAGVRVVMVCGGAFNVLSGRVPRAPGWVRRVGGEWIYRLWLEPWRWRRQLRLLTFFQLMMRG